MSKASNAECPCEIKICRPTIEKYLPHLPVKVEESIEFDESILKYHELRPIKRLYSTKKPFLDLRLLEELEKPDEQQPDIPEMKPKKSTKKHLPKIRFSKEIEESEFIKERKERLKLGKSRAFHKVDKYTIAEQFTKKKEEPLVAEEQEKQLYDKRKSKAYYTIKNTLIEQRIAEEIKEPDAPGEKTIKYLQLRSPSRPHSEVVKPKPILKPSSIIITSSSSSLYADESFPFRLMPSDDLTKSQIIDAYQTKYDKTQEKDTSKKSVEQLYFHTKKSLKIRETITFIDKELQADLEDVKTVPLGKSSYVQLTDQAQQTEKKLERTPSRREKSILRKRKTISSSRKDVSEMKTLAETLDKSENIYLGQMTAEDIELLEDEEIPEGEILQTLRKLTTEQHEKITPRTSYIRRIKETQAEVMERTDSGAKLLYLPRIESNELIKLTDSTECISRKSSAKIAIFPGSPGTHIKIIKLPKKKFSHQKTVVTHTGDTIETLDPNIPYNYKGKLEQMKRRRKIIRKIRQIQEEDFEEPLEDEIAGEFQETQRKKKREKILASKEGVRFKKKIKLKLLIHRKSERLQKFSDELDAPRVSDRSESIEAKKEELLSRKTIEQPVEPRKKSRTANGVNLQELMNLFANFTIIDKKIEVVYGDDYGQNTYQNIYLDKNGGCKFQKVGDIDLQIYDNLYSYFLNKYESFDDDIHVVKRKKRPRKSISKRYLHTEFQLNKEEQALLEAIQIKTANKRPLSPVEFTQLTILLFGKIDIHLFNKLYGHYLDSLADIEKLMLGSLGKIDYTDDSSRKSSSRSGSGKRQKRRRRKKHKPAVAVSLFSTYSETTLPSIKSDEQYYANLLETKMHYLFDAKTEFEEESESVEMKDESVKESPVEKKKPFHIRTHTTDGVQDYMTAHKINNFFEFLGAHLVAASPENPIAFLINLLDKCLEYRVNEKMPPPLLFTPEHVETLYHTLDPMEVGVINQCEYIVGMESLGIKEFNTSPELTKSGFIEKSIFIREACTRLIAQFEEMVLISLYPQYYKKNRSRRSSNSSSYG